MGIIADIPLFGSIVNACTIVLGSVLGLAVRKSLPSRILELPVQGMALFVISLGISMSIKTQQPLVVVAGIAVGSVVGELLDLEGLLGRGCSRLEKRFGPSAKGFSSGFITASLIYCTGSMAVLGSFEEGMGGYPSLLLAKSLIDGLTSVALSASLGFGVIFAAAPVFLYQGMLTLVAVWIQPFMSDAAVLEMSAAGGLMLAALGINLLGIMKIRVMNMLPALIATVLLAGFFS